MTPYVKQDLADGTKMILTSLGNQFVKVIPPYREIEIDDVLYIGITKKQLGNIVATDSTYVDVPEKIFVLYFLITSGK